MFGVLGSLLKAAGNVVSLPVQVVRDLAVPERNTPATVQALRDAAQNLRNAVDPTR